MAERRPRRWARRVGIAILAIAAIGWIAFATIDRWFLAVIDPGPFNEAAMPPKPDYASPSAWAALPSVNDGADVALPELPAIDQATAKADVFYLHPTTMLAPRWNGAFDDPTIIENTTRGGTLIQASAFNACCAVYAPRYRQAHGRAFTRPDAETERALAVAYADVSAAFDSFLDRTAGRPFIIASHSQGTVLAMRLVRERVFHQPAEARLVAAYLIGGPVRADTLGEGAPICGSATDVGCVVAYNARAPGYKPNGFEFEAALADPLAGRICVNPLTWRRDEVAAPASAHKGAVFLDGKEPKVIPAFAGAQCQGGALVVTDIGPLDRDFMSALLLRGMPGNYHPIEYQIFYVNLRQNAVERVSAFMSRAGRAP